MNLNDIYTQLLYSTAPIWVELGDGNQVSGTAFFYMHYINSNSEQGVPFLITNYHVVESAKRILTELTVREDLLPSQSNKITVELSLSLAERYSNHELDLVAIPMGQSLNQLEASNTPVFIRTITADLIPTEEQINQLSAVEEVKYISYPALARHSLPIVRSGTTATPVWSRYNNERVFLVDAEILAGVSGSPVFIANNGSYTQNNSLVVGSRVMFIGVLSESLSPGLGKVLNASLLKEFLDPIVRNLS